MLSITTNNIFKQSVTKLRNLSEKTSIFEKISNPIINDSFRNSVECQSDYSKTGQF